MQKTIIAESLGLSVPTINYESVNGFKILGSDKVIEIPISVLDLFRCPISRDIMKVPTMVCESGQFYDYEHIEKWIKIKRSDPITNIILNENGVNYICCINYLAFLLCLEKLNVNVDECKYIVLQCHHIYHNKCIIEYLANYDYHCPLCRDECGEHQANL